MFMLQCLVKKDGRKLNEEEIILDHKQRETRGKPLKRVQHHQTNLLHLVGLITSQREK